MYHLRGRNIRARNTHTAANIQSPASNLVSAATYHQHPPLETHTTASSTHRPGNTSKNVPTDKLHENSLTEDTYLVAHAWHTQPPA